MEKTTKQNDRLQKQQEQEEDHLIKKYEDQINYYWKASSSNKKSYKLYRALTIILGALVTLVSSISSAEFITSSEFLRTSFAIVTPLVAVLLTIINGFAQSFHWGATWRDMVFSAQQLQKELDRVKATPPEERDLQKELEILNDLVIEETRGFFRRVLESEAVPVNGGKSGKPRS